MNTMKISLDRLPAHVRQHIGEASLVGRKLGMRTYLVGGIVRDLILGRENLDLDFAVEGDGILFGSVLARRLGAEFLRHKRFGTAAVKGEQYKIDIAGTRRETYPCCGSLPEVSAAALKDDLLRRDFTINAMAVSVNQGDYGRLVDYYRGYDDLKKGVIRILHRASFMDDPTRILRAIRFKERFHFSLEEGTLRCLKEAVGSNALSLVDEHRIRNELVLILSEPSPGPYVKTIEQLCSFDFLKKGYTLSLDHLKLFGAIDESIRWYVSLQERIKIGHLCNWLMYLCALLKDFTPKELSDFYRHFGIRSVDQKTLSSLPHARQALEVLEKKDAPPSSAYFVLHPLSLEGIVFLYAAARQTVRAYQRVQEAIAAYLTHSRHERLHINGEDLKKLKIHPSIVYNKIFRHVLRRKIDGYIHSKEEEEQEALRVFHNL